MTGRDGMRILAAALCGVALGCAHQRPSAADRQRDEARLADELRGRVAGEIVSCVEARDLGGNHAVSENAVIFNGPGNLVYLNRPAGPCPGLIRDRVLVPTVASGRICAGDVARTYDPARNVRLGACVLGPFTPYRRAP